MENHQGTQWYFLQSCILIVAITATVSVAAADDNLIVDKGQLTFDSEGNDNPNSRYFSRKLHVPGPWSGITVGRGYDIKYKRRALVFRDLTAVGIKKNIAVKISKGVGKRGRTAQYYIKKSFLQYLVITRAQQKKLFGISYARQERETKRLTARYIKVNWNALKPKIKEVLVDLKFRGDFRPTSKTRVGQVALRKAVKDNNLKEFKKVMGNRNYWSNVPRDRFRRRINALDF